MSLKFAINLEQYVAIPRKLRKLDCVVGAGAFLIASTLSGSGEIPFAEKTNPKNVSLSLENSHFSLLRVRPREENRLNMLSRAMS